MTKRKKNPLFAPKWEKSRWSDKEGKYVPVENPRRKRNARSVTRPQATPRGRWVITATRKKNGERMYYAGGARLTQADAEAITFPSIIHADEVKKTILKDFPAKLTKNFLWQAWPISA